MTDRLTDLEIFHAVIECKSLSSAADKLQLSRASVTRSIQQLEHWLDTRLLLRTTRKIEITESGQRLLEESREILHRVEIIKDQLSSERQAISGELRVSLPAGFSNHFFSVLPKFLQQFPKIQLKLEFSDKYIDLTNDSFDIAIRAGNLQDSSIFSRRLFSFKEIVVASPGYLSNNDEPKTLTDLKDHQCILDTNQSRYDQWHFFEQGVAKMIGIKGSLILSQSNAVLDSSIAGLGIAYLPSFIVEQGIKEGKLKQVLNRYDSASYDVNALFPERDFIPKKTRVFIDFLIDAFTK